MDRRDFWLLMGVCLIWGFNFVVTKYLVSGGLGFDGAPPLFLAGLRFIGVGLCLIPFLRPIPRPFGLVAAYGLCLGAGHFAFLYLGVALTSPSTVAVVFPIYVPITTVLSMIFLGETIGWRRALGMAGAVAGVIVIGFDPGRISMSIGVVCVIAAAAMGSIASILNKRLHPGLPGLRAQAWVAVLSAPALLSISAVAETGQAAALADVDLVVVAAFVFLVLAVGVFGHTVFYQVVGRNPATVVIPLSLMASVWGVVFGVALMGDEVSVRLVVGGVLALAGCTLVALRSGRRAPADTAAQIGVR